MRYANVLISAAASCAMSGCVSASHRPVEIAAQSPSVSLGQSQSGRVEALFAPHAATSDLSGTLFVIRPGEQPYYKHFGWADWRRTPHTRQTQYHAASITKGITAAIVISLQRDGKLTLSDAVSKWLPILSSSPEISIAAVLRHRAGLPRDFPDDFDVTADKAADWLASDPSFISPDKREGYSNVGYSLLAEVVEAASGRSYAELAQQFVFEPAGMDDSVIVTAGPSKPLALAKPYTAGPRPLGVMTPVAAPISSGAGGLVTTPGDLTKWVRFLADDGYPELFTGDDPIGSIDAGSDANGRYVSVQGTLPGYVANAIAWRNGASVSYMGNLFSYPALDMKSRLLSLMSTGAVSTIKPRPADGRMTPNHFQLVGEHSLVNFGEARIERHASGKGLVLIMPDRGANWTFYLTPIADGQVHWRAFDRILRLDNNGALVSIPRAERQETSSAD